MTERKRQSYVERTDTVLRFRCGNTALEPDRDVSVEGVLDFDGMGNVIGVEIIDFRFLVGEQVLAGFAMGSTNFSDGTKFRYDEEADAFYLSLMEGKSLDQRVEECRVLLDRCGRFTGLEVALV